MIELHLPFPTSANRLWTRTRRGMRKTDEYQAWLDHAAVVARQQNKIGLAGPYKLSIQASRPDKRRRDIDNTIKGISDLLVMVGIVGDDSDCEMVTARWVTTGEGVHVRVERAVTE